MKKKNIVDILEHLVKKRFPLRTYTSLNTGGEKMEKHKATLQVAVESTGNTYEVYRADEVAGLAKRMLGDINSSVSVLPDGTHTFTDKKRAKLIAELEQIAGK